MKLKPTIKESVVGQVDKTDLYSVVEDGLLGLSIDGHENDDYDWVHAYDGRWTWKQGDHLPVEMLQEALDELKAMGATHTQIYQHSDHNGYYFTGVKCELMDEEEVKERKRKELERAIRNNTIRLGLDETELEEQRQRLEEQKKRLGEFDND